MMTLGYFLESHLKNAGTPMINYILSRVFKKWLESRKIFFTFVIFPLITGGCKRGLS
jgi:hypothetical protein